MSLIRALLNFFFPRGKLDYREPAWGVIALCAYLGMALFTFGHIAGRHPYHDYTSVPCTEVKGKDGKMYPIDKTGFEKGVRYCSIELERTVVPMTFLQGVVGGVIWPLYWSWHLQEEKPHG